jgi:hypothetical protein
MNPSERSVYPTSLWGSPPKGPNECLPSFPDVRVLRSCKMMFAISG